MSAATGASSIEISDQDILSKLRNFEDSFVERKRFSEASDWLTTAVAFANSTPIGYPAILFIGIKNNGTIEQAEDLDAVQKRLDATFNHAYPSLYYWTKTMREGDKQFLAVIIPGSERRPHFSGRAYVRAECESVEASEEMFAELIASRNDKAREILRWKHKAITAYILHPENEMYSKGRFAAKPDRVVQQCNAFYVTLSESQNEGSSHWSYPLSIVDITFDNEKGRLGLEIRPI